MIQSRKRSGPVDIIIIILLLLFLPLLPPLFAQGTQIIDLNEIHQGKVRKYIISRSIDRMDDFSSIHASWNSTTNESDFKVMVKTFYLKCDLSDVWEFYRHTDPIKMWNGQAVRFGLMICKSSKSVIYADNLNPPEIDTGQVYFLNLRLMKGLINVPVAFEVITIDEKQRIMEFSYIENNIELGKQTIRFFDDGGGYTRIVHRSYFKSGSKLRDNIFYPYFHNLFIEDFHGNMEKTVRKMKVAMVR
jgi:hypothetical protein